MRVCQELFGAQASTTGEDYAKKHEKESGYEVVSYRDLAAEQQALATGQIDGAINDYPVWTDYLKRNPGRFAVAANFDTGEKYGYAVKKGGNPKLVEAINAAIAQARTDGTYKTLYEKWIGPMP